jgi:hypothetical protein
MTANPAPVTPHDSRNAIPPTGPGITTLDWGRCLADPQSL